MKAGGIGYIFAVLGALSERMGGFSSTLQEIVSIDIQEPAGQPPFLPAKGHTYYAVFTHDEALGRLSSLPFTTIGPRLTTNVNLHIQPDGESPLKVAIYCHDPFFRDRRVGTVEFSADSLETGSKKSILSATIKNSKGNDTTTVLVLKLVQKQWKDVYGDLDNDDPSMVDPFFRASAFVLSKQVAKTVNPTADQLKPPKDEPDPNLPMDSVLDNILTFPRDGEFASIPWEAKFQLRLINTLPFTDRNTPYRNRADGIYKLRKILKGILPQPPEGPWDFPTQDLAMKRVFFSSLGMHVVQRGDGVDNGYVSNTTDLSSYRFRKHYEPLGCLTYFDNDGNILKIVDPDGTTYRPGDKYWEWAKLKSRSSAFTKVSLIHLVEAHYIWGNVPGAAMRLYLPRNHPIRRAFSVHFYKTAYTCARAKLSLFDRKGVLSRGLPFTYQGGLEQIFIDMLTDFRFKRFPDELEEKGLTDCKFHVCATDGMDLYNILSEYVNALIDEAYYEQEDLENDIPMKKTWDYITTKLKGAPLSYTKENLKAVWSEILFRVTGFHSSVGQVAAFALDPSVNNIRLQPKEVEDLVSPQESAIGVAMITAVTTVPCPRLYQDWKQVFAQPNNIPYTTLRKKLDELGRSIDERNKSRFTNIDFHPKQAALSISS